ncbi:sulfite exporter TauE/SafE family protein [uncultured Jannaschia sp.]|uniref:sulfite exporter TauE/SafE family protein n=1 Tax=uncultured Jannaschia sp. TaxID=293347 RepID=UPI002634F1FB|nr:sulfite exporter TauE/SafE family protein [uncultured Jannaschia sp.]
MTLLEELLLVVAGLAAGAINAVAGGGTFFAFGALTLVGLPPITANATSSIAQFPGYAASALAYRRELGPLWRRLVPLVVVSVAGGLIGAFVLLALDNDQFGALVPWLLVAATALFAFGPRLTRAMLARDLALPRPLGWAVQFVVAIYGGFFGGGMGIMMLASLGLTEGSEDFHHLNAMKTLLSVVTAAVTLVVFSSGGAVSWREGVVMLAAVAAGGWGGVAIARRVPQPVVRSFVIAVGLLLTAYYAVG